MPSPGSTTEDVVPLKGDFFIHGGIYRDAALVSVGYAHIALDDHGGSGVYARTIELDLEAATLEVHTRLSNLGMAGEATLRLRLLDADGREIAEDARPLRLVSGRSESLQRLRVASPRPWDGRRDPYRYRLVATLESGGRVLDRIEQSIGLRTFRVDPDHGFFLNGRHLPLHGVSRHQDLLGRGWTLGEADHIRDMALIAEMAPTACASPPCCRGVSGNHAAIGSTWWLVQVASRCSSKATRWCPRSMRSRWATRPSYR